MDVLIGYVETHGRSGTEALLEGFPILSRKKIFYKGRELEEMDLEAILRRHPQVVFVDELAHTNVEGCRNRKRWEDVMELLDAGINVVSVINIQPFESLKDDIMGISGIEVKERVPDRIERKVETEVLPTVSVHSEKILACVSSNAVIPRRVIRLASRYNTSFVALYVQTPAEASGKIKLSSQRHLLNHFKLVTELGGQVVQVSHRSVPDAITTICREQNIKTVCMGLPTLRMPQTLFNIGRYRKFIRDLAQMKIDLIIIAS